MSRHVFALLALVALAAAAGLWYWFNQTKVESLRLGAFMELRYKKDMADILCDEALNRDLKIDVQWTNKPAEAVGQVSRRELDAAIIPAGLDVAADKVCQVTMMDSQILHLFAKPEIAAQGLAGLSGHTVFLGPAGSGVRCVAGEILKYAGLAAGKDFVEDPRPYDALMKSTPGAMPDAVFSLSPLPSPMGDKLARQLGYQLVELPMGEAMGLRKPCFEDALVPAAAYAAAPVVPARPLHTIGVRSVLIANAAVPRLAVERLLEVLCESDFYPRVNLKKMDPALIQRAGDFPFHLGAGLHAPCRPLALPEAADQAARVHRLGALDLLGHPAGLAVDSCAKRSTLASINSSVPISISTRSGPPAWANSARPSWEPA